MHVTEAIERCRLACEAEAIALGFPGPMGAAIYDGCVLDDIQGWTKDEYLAWTHWVDQEFGITVWIPLYKRVCEIMGDYGKMIEQSTGRADGTP
jgi:hypothetical protein